jgi:ABC-type antimicrobial peptide transport system permease subunit
MVTFTTAATILLFFIAFIAGVVVGMIFIYKLADLLK